MGKFWGKPVLKIDLSSNHRSFPRLLPHLPQLFHRPKAFLGRIGKEFSTNPAGVLLLLSLLLLFPTNLAKHFITSQSYVLGILVDYLSPTLYLTEILVLLLLAVSALRSQSHQEPAPKTLCLLVLGFLLTLLPSVLGAGDKPVAIFRFLEISLWLGFSLWISTHIRWESHRKVFRFLGWGVFWVSLLALGQFFFQRSLFGYWFLGEPTLSPSLGGVAEGSLLGREVLRAYGTFPHPNVLGGILSVILVGLFSVKLWWPFAAGLGGVLVSLSRTAWSSLIGGILGFSLFGRGLGLVVLDDLSVSRRWELLQSAWEMIKSAPLIGVGLGQFIIHLPRFGIPSGLSLFLQPVHNIFALVAAESGIFSAALLAAFFLLALRETIRKKRVLLTVALLQLIFLGMFDHYLYTLPQGLFLFSLIIGLSFSYSEK